MEHIVALEPYYGGSHKAVLDGLVMSTQADWKLYTMAARKWKWRMRGAAISFAQQLNDGLAAGEIIPENIKLFYCSTFLNVAEFKGLLDPAFADIEFITYFHENQLVYPVRYEAEWDIHFALTNITTALASKECWFNSHYNLDSFILRTTELFKKFPDEVPEGIEASVRQKSVVIPPPFDPSDLEVHVVRGSRCRIIWPHRWEHDKNPALMVKVLSELARRSLDFEVVVCGQSHQDSVCLYEDLAHTLGDRLVYCQTPRTRSEYGRLLASSDVALSTADNEFFGLAMVEAAYCGCFVLAPKGLAYPELYSENHLYETPNELVDMLASLIVLRPEPGSLSKWAEQYTFSNMASKYDQKFARYLSNTDL